jgi:hypothetical protein
MMAFNVTIRIEKRENKRGYAIKFFSGDKMVAESMAQNWMDAEDKAVEMLGAFDPNRREMIED